MLCEGLSVSTDCNADEMRKHIQEICQQTNGAELLEELRMTVVNNIKQLDQHSDSVLNKLTGFILFIFFGIIS